MWLKSVALRFAILMETRFLLWPILTGNHRSYCSKVSLGTATSTSRLSCERRGAERWACYWLPPHRDDTTIGQCASESDETLLPQATLRKLITHYEIGRPRSLRSYLLSRFITPAPPNSKVFLIAFLKGNPPHFRCAWTVAFAHFFIIETS